MPLKKDPRSVLSNSVANQTTADTLPLDRRGFISSAAALGAAVGTLPLLGSTALGAQTIGAQAVESATEVVTNSIPKSIIGNYGPWASKLAEQPPLLSLRRPNWPNVDAWRQAARDKATELLAAPTIPQMPQVEVGRRTQFDGLDIEHLSWQLPYGRPTQAVVLKPIGATGPLPAVLGLHDHGGKKYFGLRKITRTDAEQHPLIVAHQQEYYGGLAWANELAKRGYVVLVHDAFAFASRRVMFEDMSEIPWGDCRTTDKSDGEPETTENVQIYNAWASAHEDIMAKSLFCGGTTWPGVVLAEDQAALSVLLARDDVDADRVGCAGLSGGGLRTVFLGGMDDRIRCAICVGFMSTWKDFLMNKSFTHTWMTYAPLLPRYLDFPEILGLRAPLATMVQSCYGDDLYTVPEMKRADEMLQAVYSKAAAPERYSGRFYEGGHKFDASMQHDAFEWFDRWLTPGGKAH